MVLFFLLLSFSLSACTTRKPLLFIPGVMSTVLYSKLDIPDTVPHSVIPEECVRASPEFLLWQNVSFLSKNPICNFAYIKQQYNEKTELLETIEGVDITVPEFGSTFACSKLAPNVPGKSTDYLRPVFQRLEKQGYQDGVDLFCAGYDWRKARYTLDSYISDTISLIKKIKAETKQKVMIVSHSYGGLISTFLADKFDDIENYIENYMSVATPYAGAFLSVQSMLSGLDWVPVDPKLFTDASRNIEANYQMLPNPQYWGTQNILKVGTQTFTAQNFGDVLTRLAPFGKQMEQKLRYTFGKMPNVNLTCVYSSGEETAEYAEFDDWSFENGRYQFGDGDDTVNLNSLEYCKELGFTLKHMGKKTHMTVITSEDFTNYLLGFVCDK
ncbi:1-O-acylceramide synthase precursor, putative [Entamoeba invadens IP1]|uniref:1-O-acylceramide synthase, putative n=1 Tax=Entamoeba invadens IP1 TaxID=370355 RepID=A0A0A1UFC5_ENTIV|nr:1-O-acylceramide synthase precursor, putative [Entamoeba invadens IP1]ELP92639.1 1-O-acylceramide synthase precursor, putative [Entamoeba invadens IP1]|eukprot:XP_004259410.1 1-O-acylceramide synthase precursor, putative [Entamoeba invadens IP1]